MYSTQMKVSRDDLVLGLIVITAFDFRYLIFVLDCVGYTYQSVSTWLGYTSVV